MSQYAFPLTLPAVFSEDNFFVSGCNQEAHRWVTSWPHWPAPSLLLYGPAGSGKSHLGHIWAARAKAAMFSSVPAPDAVTGNAFIDDIDKIRDEKRLLHLLNYSKERKLGLLLASSLPPKQLPFTLPDLTSRLLALPTAAINAPDDEALAGAMRKQFADRQLKVQDDVIDYMLPRMERSFAKVVQTVELLDSQALAEKKNLTIPFLKRVLGY